MGVVFFSQFLSLPRRVRTASEPFRLEHGFTLERLQQLKDNGLLEEALVSPAQLLPHFPSVLMDDVAIRRIRQKRDFASITLWC
jgi:tRNA U55 pseudouridine synthase TruB